MRDDINNLYAILNIPESIILDKNLSLHYHLSLVDFNNDAAIKIQSMNTVINILNKFHSYFHFEQSFAYIVCAYVHSLMLDTSSQERFLAKAIFQDPNNAIALDFEEAQDVNTLLNYDKHYIYEKTFLHFAIGGFHHLPVLSALDDAIEKVWFFGQTDDIFQEYNYESHRVYVTRAIAALFLKQYDLALSNIEKAIAMLETSHLNYHRFAASMYLKRAAVFEKFGEYALAKNDRVKAKDLFPG